MSMEGSHCLEKLHACTFLLSVRNSGLTCQCDKLELFLHILFLMFRLQRPELSAALMSSGLSPHFRCTCRHRPPGHILSHQYPADRPFTRWSLQAPVACNPEILNELPFFFPAGLLRDTRIKRKKNKHSGVRTGKDRRPSLFTNKHLAPPKGRSVSHFHFCFPDKISWLKAAQ